jgi:RNA polymerase sigma factor (sigma-70 family)
MDQQRRASMGATSADATMLPPGTDIAMTREAMDLAPEQLDPRRPEILALLQRRTPQGGYAVGDARLVLAIRAFAQRGDMAAANQLSELLLVRNRPMLVRHTMGLRHRPELMEEAMASIMEQLIREARDPREQFMTLNFAHYLRCLCADVFNRVLRQEGLGSVPDAGGSSAGRPNRVPRALLDPLAPESVGAEYGVADVLADPHDAIASFEATEEARRILELVDDPLDRRILILRALGGYQWDEIASLCGKTERTMRLRYEKTRTRLREQLTREY